MAGFDRVPRSATTFIAALTALAWLMALLAGVPDQAALALGFIPARLSGVAVPWSAVPAILTPISSTLVHGGLLHLAFNLIIFVWCGAQVERVLGITGLLVLYLVGAFAAALGQWAVDPASMIPMVGASGAISAVIGAYSLSFGRAKRITASPAVNRWINAIWLMIAWVALQLMTSYLAGTQGMMLATAAHVGGFLAGLILQRPLLLWRYRKA